MASKKIVHFLARRRMLVLAVCVVAAVAGARFGAHTPLPFGFWEGPL